MRTTTTLILAILAASFAASSAWAEEIKSGYLIINGQMTPPPFRVEIVGSTVTVNGIQTYPPILNAKEAKQRLDEKEARELLDSMHEEFAKEKKLHGHGKALGLARDEMKKHLKFKNHTIRETKMGVEVNLVGVDDPKNIPYIRYMREDNAPSRMKEIRAAQDRIVSQYKEWREKQGKARALDLVDAELRKEPLIVEYKLDREHEAFHVRWQGQPYGGGVGLWPEGYPGATLPSKDESKQRRLNFQADEIRKPLKMGWCVVVFGGSIFDASHGRAACEDVARIIREKLPEQDAMPILTKHFDGREKYLWQKLEQYGDN
ncbi:MAG: hypothetical protein HY924_07410 [Elusimicrobia bacterium]|nr:hypothetical protein [Elusimicrobiota bacterium]